MMSRKRQNEYLRIHWLRRALQLMWRMTITGRLEETMMKFNHVEEKKKSKTVESMNLAFGSNTVKINPKIMINICQVISHNIEHGISTERSCVFSIL